METVKLTELKQGKDFIITEGVKGNAIAKIVRDINVVVNVDSHDEDNDWHYTAIDGTEGKKNFELINLIEEFPGDLIIEQGACLEIDSNISYFQVKGDIVVDGNISVDILFNGNLCSDDSESEKKGWVSVLGDIKLGPTGTKQGKLSFIELSGEVTPNFDIDDFKNKRHIAFLCHEDEVFGVSVDKDDVVSYFVDQVEEEGDDNYAIYVYEVEECDNFDIMTNMCFGQMDHELRFPAKKLKI